MAKRSKKKNPNVLSEKQKADIRHNQMLDEQKDKLDKKLNITIGVVIALTLVAFLLLPTLNMNFSGSLSDILGDMVSEENDQEMGVVVNMSNIDILFAMTKGYKDSIEYIVNSNSSGIAASIMYQAFMTKVTQEDIDMLDFAYIVSFILAILLIISLLVFIVMSCVNRIKKRDGISLLIATIIFSAFAIAQWIFFICVGIASAGRAQIQPHIASYLLLACGVTLCSVYGVYRNKVKKLNKQRKTLDDTSQKGDK